MRKREILKHYKSSLKKWGYVLEDIKDKENLCYETKYWVSCGFCIIFGEDCDKCVLHSKNSKKRLYCFRWCDCTAYDVLIFATTGRWTGAEKLCKQFIAKIKREIKKVENK